MNPVALITGAGSGIGKSTASVFQKNGWHVIGVDRRPRASAGKTRHLIKADLSETTAPARIVKEVLARERRLDALINNAAIRPKDVAEAIYFLASKQTAAFITGQSLVVDGGASARLSTE